MHTRQSGAPSDRWPGHASRADCAADRWLDRPLAHRTVRCTPDSPVNYSRTPLISSREHQVQPKPALSRCTGLSGGAPDSVRCARLASGNWLLSGFRRRRTAINHRTVRWCTGLSGEPTVGRANGRPRNPRATRGRANGQKVAPDCPVCTGQCPVRQLPRRCNGHLRQIRKEIRTGHATVNVRCTTRQKATLAFLVGLQRLLAALGL